ncbi:MAG TPA: glutamate-cysteine ligase family protein [Pyrinomonadaceae bacterium]|nr:glutamate-cysteine ligase family protein [Pyrinomonadaceae bacterium]
MTTRDERAELGAREGGGARPGAETAARAKAGREAFPLLTEAVSTDSAPLFAENLRRGAKPEEAWPCGVEFEQFGYDAGRGMSRLSPAQVQRVLAGFAPSSNDLHYEGAALIEVNAGQMNRLTVEPGGQIEFSGAPQRRLSDVEREIRRYLARLSEIAAGHNFVFLACGFDPLRTLGEQNWFPKSRYDVMRPYLARRGARAWDMMTRTCAVQTNLDYGGGDDLRKKFLVGNRLAPVVTAIFANSPFEGGRASGYKSTRAAAWLATDPDRTLLSPPALSDDFTPERFVAYALEVPMLFAQRDGVYLDAPTGTKFGDFLARGCPGVEPQFGDWADHLTTIFTDARLKQHIELRGADCGSLADALALQALWKGLLYDAGALDEALRLAPRLDLAASTGLRESVARDALEARVDGVSVKDLAKEIVVLAAEGLSRVSPDEIHYLDPLRARVVEEGVAPADILLRNFRGGWRSSMERVVEHLRIA